VFVASVVRPRRPESIAPPLIVVLSDETANVRRRKQQRNAGAGCQRALEFVPHGCRIGNAKLVPMKRQPFGC
jgi:hypothetical protein